MVRLKNGFHDYDNTTFIQEAKKYGFIGYVTHVIPEAKRPYRVEFDELPCGIYCTEKDITRVRDGN